MNNANEILFIDDEECIRDVAARMLDGFSVTTLENGDRAAAAVADKKPCMVFLDIMMPGKDGLEVLKEIKAASPDTPVVMISGHMSSDYAIMAGKGGACDYILKPIDWKYLRNVAHLYSMIGRSSSRPAA